jgi:sterol desaturase/sphingolipid hydroxylase (fatty acid hydroxylase superfamily)
MFKKLYYRYLQALLIFSIIITAIYIGLRYFAPDLVSNNLPLLIIIFVFVTAITHYVVTRTDVERIERKPNPELSKEEQMKEIATIERKFITRYLFITVVKILSFLIFLALYAWFNKTDAIRFLLNFMAIYLIYSLFELIYIRKPIRR